MAFCDHCDGQRFDRSRVLRLLRAAKREAILAESTEVANVLQALLTAVRDLDLPHLERLDDIVDGEMVH